MTAATATQTPVRHKWTADEKSGLISEIEAAKGDAAARKAVLAKYSEITGAQPASVNAVYYALKAKAGQPVGTPRGTTGVKRTGHSVETIEKRIKIRVERIAQDQSDLKELRVALKEAKKAEATAAKALAKRVEDERKAAEAALAAAQAKLAELSPA